IASHRLNMRVRIARDLHLAPRRRNRQTRQPGAHGGIANDTRRIAVGEPPTAANPYDFQRRGLDMRNTETIEQLFFRHLRHVGKTGQKAARKMMSTMTTTPMM